MRRSLGKAWRGVLLFVAGEIIDIGRAVLVIVAMAIPVALPNISDAPWWVIGPVMLLYLALVAAGLIWWLRRSERQ